MRKIILPLVVIAASGGYVWSQQARISAENAMGADTQTLDAQVASPPALTPPPVAAAGAKVKPAKLARASVAAVNLVGPASDPLPTPAAKEPAPAEPAAPLPVPADEPVAAVPSAPEAVPAPSQAAIPEATTDIPVPMPRLQRSEPTLPAMSVAAAVAAPSAVQGQYRDGVYKGATEDAYYGLVQVQANVQNGAIASVKVLQYPNDRRTSRYINSQALPMLQQEAIQAQSAQVDFVSGATLTSGAYVKSLRNALAQAKS